MRRLLFVLPFVFAACESAPITGPQASERVMAPSFASKAAATCTIGTKTYQRGFDEFGYNRCARNFVGVFGGWCAQYGAGWNCEAPGWEGYAPFANDHLVMKWNAEWDRGKIEGWTDPNGYGAWEDNEWNGMLPNGSRVTEHVKIIWVGSCGADGTVLPDGGSCIWGQFEVLMDQGMNDGVRYVLSHVTPNGYGARR